MKYRFSIIPFQVVDECVSKIIIQYKKHWWSKWKYFMDGSVPKMYSNDDITWRMLRNIKAKIK